MNERAHHARGKCGGGVECGGKDRRLLRMLRVEIVERFIGL